MRKLFLIGASITAVLMATSANGQYTEQQRRSDAAAKKRAMAEALTKPVGGGAFLNQRQPNSKANTPTGAPIAAFKGCTGPKILQDTADNAQRMRAREAGMTDPISARRFAAIDIDPNEQASAQDIAADCRYRLDGVWRQDVPIAFDNSKSPNVFSGLPGETLKPKLTHGSYTTPVLMYVDSTNDGRQLSIRPATQGRRPIILRSSDGISLTEMFKPNGRVKTYVTIARPHIKLAVNTDRFGRVRMRWGGFNFYRPKPTVSESQNVSSVDVFAVGFNLDNLAANRRGYNIVTQDVFELNDNSKAEVFAVADPKDYAIVEKRTVPLGLKLIPEGTQGTIISSRLISSQTEYQKTVKSSLGVNVGFKALGPDGKSIEDLGSASAGVDYTEEKTEGMRSGSKQSQSVGFARHKLYSLVLDRPFAKLSRDFIVALDDARRFGRYDEVIRKFGTHYPYAVTYGSSARMETSFSQQTVAKWKADSENVNTNAGFSILGFGASVKGSVYTQTNQSNEQLNQASSKSFDAVGGTGSFGGSGHSTGTPYPILSDLRPLHELLNPLNFPNEPAIYGPVRAELKSAIAKYLKQHALTLSSISNEPALKHTWEFTSHYIECVNIGNVWDEDITNRKSIELPGTIRLRAFAPNGSAVRTVTPFNQAVNQRGAVKKINCPNGRLAMPGTKKMRFTGTPAALAKYRFRYHVNLHEWDEGVFNPSDVITKTPSHMIGFPVKAGNKLGATYTRTWQMNTRTSGQPLLKIKSTFIRVK